MTIPHLPSLPQVRSLNATPLSLNVAKLLREAKREVPTHNLVLTALMEYQTEQYQSPVTAEMELGAVVNAERADPAAVYANLADPRLETATSIEDAGAILASRLDEILPA